jgi:hypothetical protein
VSKGTRDDVRMHSPFMGSTRLVHMALGEVANDGYGRRLWLSIPTIAEMAKVSERTVRRALKTLVAAGWLELVDSEDGRRPGPGRPQQYRFLLSSEVGTAAKSSTTAAKSSTTAAISVIEPRSTTAAKSSTTAAISVIEPRPIATRRASSTRTELNLNRRTQPVAVAVTVEPTLNLELARLADELARLAYEQPVKPALRSSNGRAYFAVQDIFRTMLEAGTPVERLRDAVVAGVKVWTLAGVQTSVAQLGGRRARGPMSGVSDEALAIVTGDFAQNGRRP